MIDKDYIEIEVLVIVKTEDLMIPAYKMRELFDGAIPGYEVKGLHDYRPTDIKIKSPRIARKFIMTLFKQD